MFMHENQAVIDFLKANPTMRHTEAAREISKSIVPLSNTTVAKIRCRLGLEFTKQKPAHFMGDEKRKQITDYIKANHLSVPIRLISIKFNVSISTVNRICKECGASRANEPTGKKVIMDRNDPLRGREIIRTGNLTVHRMI